MRMMRDGLITLGLVPRLRAMFCCIRFRQLADAQVLLHCEHQFFELRKRIKLTHVYEVPLTIKAPQLKTSHVDTMCIRVNQYHIYSIL